MGYEAIIEGICPEHRLPLERRDDCGWCVECNSGWSMAGDTVRVHLHVDAGHSVTGSIIVDDNA